MLYVVVSQDGRLLLNTRSPDKVYGFVMGSADSYDEDTARGVIKGVNYAVLSVWDVIEDYEEGDVLWHVLAGSKKRSVQLVGIHKGERYVKKVSF